MIKSHGIYIPDSEIELFITYNYEEPVETIWTSSDGSPGINGTPASAEIYDIKLLHGKLLDLLFLIEEKGVSYLEDLLIEDNE